MLVKIASTRIVILRISSLYDIWKLVPSLSDNLSLGLILLIMATRRPLNQSF